MNHEPRLLRRTAIQSAAAGLWSCSQLSSHSLFAASRVDSSEEQGILIGEPTAERIAIGIFASGGNAVDAIVAAALAAAVAAPHQTGIGGYGASGMVAFDKGRRVVALDANSMAPANMTSDLFESKEGKPLNDINFGWKSAGVPGILSGLQLLLKEFGTKSFRECVQPAILICRQGFAWPTNVAKIIQDGKARFGADPGSRKLYFRNDQPLAAGATFTNPDLADLLERLAQADSVEPFYRGDIAQKIADAFQRNGGLVTAQDLADYHAKLQKPLSIKVGAKTIYTAPPTAGGLTVLQVLMLLKELNWNSMASGIERTMTQIESMRLAWRDRLLLLGDPDHSEVPINRLLSQDYVKQNAELVRKAIRDKSPISHAIKPKEQSGTIHLSSMDRDGNFAALTLTHGGSFGARVTVDGLGLTLGHGMSRFESMPNHPNSPGPKKRPLHNMVPTIVFDGDKPVLAAGGRGGRKIPNAMLEFLAQSVLMDQPLLESMKSPRIHTEGNLAVEFESHWPPMEVSTMKPLGYSSKNAASATLSAVALEDSMKKAMR